MGKENHMEPLEPEEFSPEELSEPQLNAMLSHWDVPRAPARLRSSVFPEKTAPWWRRSIPVPLPIAAVIVVAIVYGAIRLAAPTPAAVKWRPVNEIRVRIIRSNHAQN
jgi:hypothetical protein